MGNYIPATDTHRQEMMDYLGIKDIDELFSDIPESVRLDRDLDIPAGLNEADLVADMEVLSLKNTVYKKIFRGAGIYDRYIPAIVPYITSKEEFLTAYTPYQPEISQGVLQSIFEYQTMVCELTGMDAANASVYDGATGLAEAVAMCGDRRKNKVILSEGLHPQSIEVVKTYCFGSGMEVAMAPLKDGKTDMEALSSMIDESTACVCIAQPNFYGNIEEANDIGILAQEKKTKFVMSVEPTSLGLLQSPREAGADVVVGDGQSLGLPLSFGGPTFGFMACTNAMLRKLPGRIAGETVDSEGNRIFVLTLQAREQHIRREKASSNICSNQALCAMTASVYLSAVGYEGLKQAAQSSLNNAHYLYEQISQIPGFEPAFPDSLFFNEFVTKSPIDPEELNELLAQKGILGGLSVSLGHEESVESGDGKILNNGSKDHLLWCATEKNSLADMDELVTILKEVAS